MSSLNAAGSLDGVLDGLDGRGRGFEALTGWFLRNDPEWAARIARVWRWDDWPGRWGPDRGIDLVAETLGGALIAVQCKHYGYRYTVTKADVDSFLSESNRAGFAERLLVATTNRLSAGAEQVIAAQEKPVTVALRDRLQTADVDWSAYATGAPSALERSVPRRHQERAVAEVLAGLRYDARGQMLMPCGTGKTLTSMWIAEGLNAACTLVLMPTLVLLRQTAQVWRAQASTPFALLKVCSDTTLDDEVARADVPVAHVGGPVTTDPVEIARFLSSEGRRVVFCTYDSSPCIAAALSRLPGVALDLVVCDEAHHCAGVHSGAHRTALDDAKIPAKRRLFVTATPTVFGFRAREQARQARVKLASMDDRKLFGRVLHELTFESAVEQKLLCPYQVVVMPVTDQDVLELVRRRKLVTVDGEHVTDAYQLAAQIASLRTMRRFACRRLIAFHPSVDASRRFARDVRLSFELLHPADRPNSVHAAHVDGYMSRPQREQALHRFTSDDDSRQVLSNVRLLAEGFDVPGIDGICLIDTHRRASAIVQAIGRAVRPAPGKTVGTVLLPVLVREGQGIDSALQTSEHKPVLDVLAALRSMDATISTTVDAVRVEVGPRGPGGGNAHGSWVIDAPTEVGEEFADAVEVCLVELLNAKTSRASSTHDARVTSYDEPVFSASIDWTDPEEISRGLRYAESWLRSHPAGPITAYEMYRGYPLGTWRGYVLEHWRRGRLSETLKRSCAPMLNWLTIPRDRFSVVRSDVAARDTIPIWERVDEWLSWRYYDRGDDEVDQLVRARVIGHLAPIRTREIHDRMPDGMTAEQSAEAIVKTLKLAGRALIASSDRAKAEQGFREGLREPGREHGLDVRPGPDGRSSGSFASFARGWDAAQDAHERVIRPATSRMARKRSPGPARRAASSSETTGRGRSDRKPDGRR